MYEKTDAYLRGMQAVNNFYSMLYSAMLEAMDGVLISKNGAYVWRGYRIDTYLDLAPGQYYCQIYPGNPDSFIRHDGSINAFTCKDLIFHEAYKDPKHKPIDRREIKHCIKTGNYYYPFQISLDLYRSRFFLLSVSEQHTMLKNFIAMAAEQALLWQHSEARLRTTNQKFINGKKQTRSPVKNRRLFERISMDFLDVWKMQTDLFSVLVRSLQNNAQRITGKPIAYLRPNAHIQNFDFRGYRLKFDGLFEGSQSDYRWAIYYETPELLHCFFNDGKRLIPHKIYNLKEQGWFDLTVELQESEILDFVILCLTQALDQKK